MRDGDNPLSNLAVDTEATPITSAVTRHLGYFRGKLPSVAATDQPHGERWAVADARYILSGRRNTPITGQYIINYLINLGVVLSTPAEPQRRRRDRSNRTRRSVQCSEFNAATSIACGSVRLCVCLGIGIEIWSETEIENTKDDVSPRRRCRRQKRHKARSALIGDKDLMEEPCTQEHCARYFSGVHQKAVASRKNGGRVRVKRRDASKCHGCAETENVPGCVAGDAPNVTRGSDVKEWGYF
ncbi:hypothetical protein EVAR_66842_1 [Eumeta japonica]|uniref:Uncharacterized protein n=1 Tax=Eumeta variegata TaxID=151549 RepID=A0A4C1ZBN3_EUMVA|nr:hypothetical protein EVAR_66842_1 [Eumeta japonica]